MKRVVERTWTADIESLYRETALSMERVCDNLIRARKSPTHLTRPFRLGRDAVFRSPPGDGAWTVVPCEFAAHSVVVLLQDDKSAYYLDANELDPNHMFERARAAFAPRHMHRLLPETFPHVEILRWRVSRGVCMAVTYWVALNFILNPHLSVRQFRDYLRYRITQWTPADEITRVTRFLRAHVPHTRSNVAGLPLLAPRFDPRVICRRMGQAHGGGRWSEMQSAVENLQQNISYEQYVTCPDEVSQYVQLDPSHTQPRYIQPTPHARSTRNASPLEVWPHFLEAQVLLFCGFVREMSAIITHRSDRSRRRRAEHDDLR